MVEAFSTSRSRIKAFVLLEVCVLFAISSVVVGINDNPPGVLLAFIAAIAGVLAFVHPWRAVKKFASLLLASVIGFVLFIFLIIISDSITQNPETSTDLLNLIQNPVNDALSLILTMIFSAMFFVGIIGLVAIFIHNRRRKR